MLPYKEKLSNFNMSTRQNWSSPIETLQEKDKMTHYMLLLLQGNEIMTLASLLEFSSKSQCARARADGMSRNFHLEYLQMVVS